MATTKLDLLKDRLTELLIDFDFQFGLDDDGEHDKTRDEQVRKEIVEDMISALDFYDSRAEKSDFTIRVVMDKKIDTNTEYGEVYPDENTKESEVL
jgi:hypothetical protein